MGLPGHLRGVCTTASVWPRPSELQPMACRPADLAPAAALCLLLRFLQARDTAVFAVFPTDCAFCTLCSSSSLPGPGPIPAHSSFPVTMRRYKPRQGCSLDYGFPLISASLERIPTLSNLNFICLSSMSSIFKMIIFEKKLVFICVCIYVQHVYTCTHAGVNAGAHRGQKMALDGPSPQSWSYRCL